LVLGTILLFTLCIFSVSSVSGQGEMTITRIKGGTNTNVPKVLTLKETGLGQVMQGTSTLAKGFEIPLVAVIHNGKIINIHDENYPEKSTFQLASYNPTLTFQFGKGSKVPLWNIKELFVGKVKSYPNSTQALESGIIFTDIELNQDTVLKLEDNGPSYMVADVQFGKNISGIYSVTFDNTPYGDKSSDRSQLASELEDNNLAIANSSTVEINTDDSFISVVQSVMCHTSSSYGFQICGHIEPLKTG
jgi:hypothetical protein